MTVSAVPGLAGVTGAPPESSESCRKLQASEGEGSASGALRGLPPSHPKPPPAETALSGRVRVVSLVLSLHRFGLPGALRPPQGTAVPWWEFPGVEITQKDKRSAPGAPSRRCTNSPPAVHQAAEPTVLCGKRVLPTQTAGPGDYLVQAEGLRARGERHGAGQNALPSLAHSLHAGPESAPGCAWPTQGKYSFQKGVFVGVCSRTPVGAGSRSGQERGPGCWPGSSPCCWATLGGLHARSRPQFLLCAMGMILAPSCSRSCEDQVGQMHV